ncbi:MAG: hypothetical protein WA946_05125 [Nitrospirota bacterium]
MSKQAHSGLSTRPLWTYHVFDVHAGDREKDNAVPLLAGPMPTGQAAWHRSEAEARSQLNVSEFYYEFVMVKAKETRWLVMTLKMCGLLDVSKQVGKT